MKSSKIVTRVAPSPSSPYGAHIGNLRTALFNYLYAKQNGGTFYLRIEDTDQDRFCPGAEELLKRSFEWLGLIPDFAPWTENQPYGPMRQSERDYSKYIQYLIDNGLAYYAFDTKDELDALRAADQNFSYGHSNRMNLNNSLALSEDKVKELLDNKTPYTIRFKVMPGQTITFNDIIRDEVTFDSSLMDDKVLVKTSGIPTYHLANICDDHDMGTTHTMRGEEWLSSTPLHIMIYEAFGWDCPQFAHLPLVLNPPPLKGKLSKRNAINLGFPIFPFGGESTEGYLKGFVDEGYDPAAVINFLLLLGWSPHNLEQTGEIMSIEDGIKHFDIKHIHKAGARYDIDKLKFFNGYYLQNKTSDEELLKHVSFGNTNFSNEEKLDILDMAKKRSHFKHEMQHVVDLFINPVTLSEKQLATVTDLHKEVFNTFIAKIWDSEVWNADYIKQALFESCEAHGMKIGKLMPVVRTILAGGITGPDMISFMTIIGKSSVISRIRATQPLPTGGLAPEEV
jgi:glutamyl-tRNA synthetase